MCSGCRLISDLATVVASVSRAVNNGGRWLRETPPKRDALTNLASSPLTFFSLTSPDEENEKEEHLGRETWKAWLGGQLWLRAWEEGTNKQTHRTCLVISWGFSLAPETVAGSPCISVCDSLSVNMVRCVIFTNVAEYINWNSPTKVYKSPIYY